MSLSTAPAGLDEPAGSGKSSWAQFLQAFTPKSIVCLREGYGRQFFMNDLVAGLTVGIIALPLSMALAIGSGARPEQGLYTAIIAGFLISALGGSRVQIGGPTGAFMALVAVVMAKHGYEGLAICTLMAGLILIVMGIARLGAMIKFIPYPVTTGFTSGIAVIIFSQQIKDFFGLRIDKVPTEFVEKWHVLLSSMGTTSWMTLGLGVGALVLMSVIRRFAPRIPGALVVVVLGGLFVAILHPDRPQFVVAGPATSLVATSPGAASAPASGGTLARTDSGCALTRDGQKVAWKIGEKLPDNVEIRYDVETIETRFGSIPRSLPMPSMPITLNSWAAVGKALGRARDLIPEASTIAMLAAIESLLCAVVADGMIGGRHKSNCELVAQGVANIGSVVFFGIPATGAIARTAASVKAGARTPLAGMIHAVTLLALMLLLAPYAKLVPLSILAAVLMVVAWNMSELDHFRSLLRAPRSDVAVLLTTFGLTVLADLTVAVGVGMVLAALLFMRRMSEVTNLGVVKQEMDESAGTELTDAGDPNAISIRDVPPRVEVYEINGPFFFGVADLLKDTLRQVEKPPKVFILRLRRVPAIDASGMHALEEFYYKCKRQGTRLLLAGVHAQPMFALMKYGLTDRIGEQNMFGNIDDALEEARKTVGWPPPEHQPAHIAEVARERTDTGL
ncbi:MAG: SulP family inorganic anion transporter [Phycisphaerae bacterium]